MLGHRGPDWRREDRSGAGAGGARRGPGEHRDRHLGRRLRASGPRGRASAAAAGLPRRAHDASRRRARLPHRPRGRLAGHGDRSADDQHRLPGLRRPAGGARPAPAGGPSPAASGPAGPRAGRPGRGGARHRQHHRAGLPWGARVVCAHGGGGGPAPAVAAAPGRRRHRRGPGGGRRHCDRAPRRARHRLRGARPGTGSAGDGAVHLLRLLEPHRGRAARAAAGPPGSEGGADQRGPHRRRRAPVAQSHRALAASGVPAGLAGRRRRLADPSRGRDALPGRRRRPRRRVLRAPGRHAGQAGAVVPGALREGAGRTRPDRAPHPGVPGLRPRGLRRAADPPGRFPIGADGAHPSHRGRGAQPAPRPDDRHRLRARGDRGRGGGQCHRQPPGPARGTGHHPP